MELNIQAHKKRLAVILGSSNCDIVNFYFQILSANTATLGRKTAPFGAEAAAGPLIWRGALRLGFDVYQPLVRIS
jgi:hypothetical protein